MGLLFFLLVISSAVVVNALNNGLALTPPMGWLSWERFRCITDCETYPNECISEKLYMDMADRLVEGGFATVGYKYVNVDDCWAEKQRDPKTGQMVADRKVNFDTGGFKPSSDSC